MSSLLLAPQDLRPGDLFVTRNAGGPESDRRKEINDTPGFWNHTAGYAGDGIVIEAQAKEIPEAPWFITCSGVIETKLEVFWARYPVIEVRRYEGSPRAGEIAAMRAKELVGLPYSRIASLYMHLRTEERGENCVSVWRRAWEQALGRDPRWHKPDGVANDKSYRLLYMKAVSE
jgi:hypothetical protein